MEKLNSKIIISKVKITMSIEGFSIKKEQIKILKNIIEQKSDSNSIIEERKKMLLNKKEKIWYAM
jgi:hypothetical protein